MQSTSYTLGGDKERAPLPKKNPSSIPLLGATVIPDNVFSMQYLPCFTACRGRLMVFS